MISILLVVIGFNHEGFLFFIPFFILIIINEIVNIKKMLLCFAPSALTFIGISIFSPPASEAQIHAIAAAIDPTRIAEWSDGAISSLSDTMRVVFYEVASAYNYKNMTSFMLGILYVSIPLYFGIKKYHKKILNT